MMTDKEHHAVVRALEWVRRECDLDFAFDGETPAQRSALTRAIRKLGGDPYPPSLRSQMPHEIRAELDGMIAGARAARAPESGPPNPERTIGFQTNRSEADA